MLHLAGREADWKAYRRLAPLVDGDTMDLIDRVALAEGTRDTAAIRAQIDRVNIAGPSEAFDAVLEGALWTGDVANSERVARRAIDAGQTNELRVAGRLALGLLDVMRGQWQQGRRDLGAVASSGVGHVPYLGNVTGIARGVQVGCAMVPFLQLPGFEVRRLRDEVAGDTASSPGPTAVRAVGLRPARHLYTLGVLNARAGHADSALAVAGRMEKLPVPAGLDTVVMGMALGVRAQAAWASGQTDRALALADSAVRIPVPADVRGVWNGHLENYVRAELLYQRGRYEDALPLWRNSLDVGRDDFLFAAIVQLRLGQIYDHLGNTQEAIPHYTRFIQLWQNADPPLQPLVQQARQRLQQLQGAQG